MQLQRNQTPLGLVQGPCRCNSASLVTKVFLCLTQATACFNRSRQREHSLNCSNAMILYHWSKTKIVWWTLIKTTSQPTMMEYKILSLVTNKNPTQKHKVYHLRVASAIRWHLLAYRPIRASYLTSLWSYCRWTTETWTQLATLVS